MGTDGLGIGEDAAVPTPSLAAVYHVLRPYSPEAVAARTPGCTPLLPQAAALCPPRLQPSAAAGCTPLLPHQARASAEAALQQLSHALRALRATWAGALPAAL